MKFSDLCWREVQIIKSLLLLKTTLTSLTAAPGRQFYGWKEDEKGHPVPAGALARSHYRYSRLCSQELGKGSRRHTDIAPRGSQAEQPLPSVSNITGEEKITSKSFLAVSEIKPGLDHKAQQMSQEPAVTRNIWWWPKPAQWSAVSHQKPFHSWLTPGSPDRAVSSRISSKSLEIQHGLLSSVCCLLWYL